MAESLTSKSCQENSNAPRSLKVCWKCSGSRSTAWTSASRRRPLLTPGLPSRPKNCTGKGPCEVVLSQWEAGTEDPLLTCQRYLAAGGWWCMCMLRVQLSGAKFDHTFLLPLKVLHGSWVQWWVAQSRAHASLLVDYAIIPLTSDVLGIHSQYGSFRPKKKWLEGPRPQSLYVMGHCETLVSECS